MRINKKNVFQIIRFLLYLMFIVLDKLFDLLKERKEEKEEGRKEVEREGRNLTKDICLIFGSEIFRGIRCTWRTKTDSLRTVKL